MSLEVRIPKEIKEYKEKIMLGMSLRQIVCLVAAFVICIPVYLLLYKPLGDNANTIVVIIAIPFLAVGFVNYKGFTFEEYMKLKISRILFPQKKFYMTENINAFLSEITTEEEIKNVQKKGKDIENIISIGASELKRRSNISRTKAIEEIKKAKSKKNK